MVDQRKRSNKVLVGVLGGLGVVALVLAVVVIAVMVNKPKEQTYAEISEAKQDTAIINSSIVNKVYGKTYTTEEAEKEFQNELEKAEGVAKVYMAMHYASFAYSADKDVERAVQILRSTETEIHSDDVFADYYTAIANLYNLAGDTEQYDQYVQKSMSYRSDSVIEFGDEELLEGENE